MQKGVKHKPSHKQLNKQNSDTPSMRWFYFGLKSRPHSSRHFEVEAVRDHFEQGTEYAQSISEREAGRQTDQTDRQTDGQTDRQTETEKQKDGGQTSTIKMYVFPCRFFQRIPSFLSFTCRCFVPSLVDLLTFCLLSFFPAMLRMSPSHVDDFPVIC